MDRSPVGPRSTLAWVAALSPRLAAIVDALPLRPGLRVIEIGCGPGAAAREVTKRVGPRGHVLAVDRSAKAIAQLTESADDLIAARRLTTRHVAAEALELGPGEERYDIAFAVLVGAFDGRHPRTGSQALERLSHVLVPGGRLFVDGGNPLREITVQ
jgi:ubiquinone/menaquinone biosynthesis C-methylase UbiE